VEGGGQGEAGAPRRWEELEAHGTRDGIVCLAPPLGVPLYSGEWVHLTPPPRLPRAATARARVGPPKP
jgi:hypothetical protein